MKLLTLSLITSRPADRATRERRPIFPYFFFSKFHRTSGQDPVRHLAAIHASPRLQNQRVRHVWSVSHEV